MFISAIIPAYNEENTVGDVVETIKKVSGIHEIIVVSDGSEDNTAYIAKKCGATVLELGENMGKGAAIKEGLVICKGDIVLLLDADLIGLTDRHITDLLAPVLKGEADMTVGVFSNGRLTTNLAQKIAPQLSGQRAVRKQILDRIANLEDMGFGIEMALTKHAEKENIRVAEIELEHLTHIMKEEKFGFVKGFGQRIRMYWQIVRGARLIRR